MMAMSAGSPSARAASPHQLHQEIDGPAHVGRDQDRNLGAAAFHRRALTGIEAGRADDQGYSPLDTAAHDRERPLRQREIDHHVDRRLGRHRRAKRHPQRGNPRQRPGIFAQMRMPRPLQGRAKLQPGIPRDKLDQPRAHAPGGPMDADNENRLSHA